MFDEEQRLPHHYHRTKYESERMVREGVKAKTLVFRPGIVVGHSETGEMDKIDGPYYFFKLLQKLRHACRSGSRWPGRRAGRSTSCRWTSSRGDGPHRAPARRGPARRHLPPRHPEPMTRRRGAQRVREGGARPAVRDAHRLEHDQRHPQAGAAGIMALPTVKRIRNQVYHDLGIPPAAMENRDFRRFDARDTQRAL